MTGSPEDRPTATCPKCGKLCFLSRKGARAYMKKWNPPSGPYQYMSVYRCGDYWHYGHTPYEVARGLKGRRRDPGPRA